MTGLDQAAGWLRAGHLVAFPTETVYGLGADATNGDAVAAIYAAKGRPRFNPLIAHYADAEAAFADVVANDAARALAARFWPGPLTLVLPRAGDSRVHALAAAGLDTLAVRVPAHPLALALLRAFGGPVAAPSANPSGGVSPTTAAHVRDGLGDRVAAILDGGPCAVGLESTVLDLSGPEPVLLRPGGIPAEELGPVAPHKGGPLRAPGGLASHYAPGLPVRLGPPRPGDALLGFGPDAPLAALTWNLSATGDLTEAATRLFAGLRWLDAEGRRRGCPVIAAALVPEHGLGRAINDRLRRAAAPRHTGA